MFSPGVLLLFFEFHNLRIVFRERVDGTGARDKLGID